jgi:hypothetical protein
MVQVLAKSFMIATRTDDWANNPAPRRRPWRSSWIGRFLARRPGPVPLTPPRGGQNTARAAL